MYKDILLDHYRNPRNFGHLKVKTHTVRLYNPLCGDVVELDASVKNGKVESVAFSGEGCVISTAAASILTEYAKGKKLSELINLDRKSMIKLIGIEVTAGRIKCLMLPLEALQKAIGKEQL